MKVSSVGRKLDCRRYVLGEWHNETERAGLTGLIPHDLSRSAVRNLERAGVPRSIGCSSQGT